MQVLCVYMAEELLHGSMEQPSANPSPPSPILQPSHCTRLCAHRDYNAKPCHLPGARPALGSPPPPPPAFIFLKPQTG